MKSSVFYRLTFLALCFFSITKAYAAIDRFPIGTGLLSIKEKGIQAPYKETENYNYAKGIVYNRWVYSPWLRVSKVENGQKAASEDLTKDSSYLSAEITASTSNLEPHKTYTLQAEALFDCPLSSGEGEKETGCVSAFVVRCYGYVNSVWTRILDETRDNIVSGSGEKSVLASGVLVTKEKCPDDIGVTFKTRLKKNAQHFLFKELKVGFLPAAKK